MKRNTTKVAAICLMILVAINGCSGVENQRVAEMAERANAQQSRQNESMAKLQQEVAEGTRRLVEADAQARREMIAVQKDLQTERTDLNTQRHALEAERKAIARQRQTESMLVPVAKGVGVALLATIIVGFCWTLLFGLQQQEAGDSEVVEFLLSEITREDSVLFPPPTASPPSNSLASSTDTASLPPPD